jgi:hypothetical protein
MNATFPPDTALTTIQLAARFAAVIVAVCFIALMTFGTLHLKKVEAKIGGMIKSRSDLDQVRAAIQMNLLLGIPQVCLGILLVSLLFWISDGWFAFACLGGLVLAEVVLWIKLRPIQTRFKALPVAPGQEELAAEYSSYVKQWNGPHLFLKPAKIGT